MSGYANHPPHLRALSAEATQNQLDPGLIDSLIAQLADQVAARIADKMQAAPDGGDEWFDSRHAAEYLGVHRDTLRKLAAEHAIPSEQDGPGCKLYFRRSDLDSWRLSGGRPRHLAAAA